MRIQVAAFTGIDLGNFGAGGMNTVRIIAGLLVAVKFKGVSNDVHEKVAEWQWGFFGDIDELELLIVSHQINPNIIKEFTVKQISSII